ncbi:MAG: FesM [Acidobacteriota bacterium]
MSSSDNLRSVDLLRWPIVGPFLRWRHARTSLQLVFLLAAVVVILHGFFGPDIASANLSTTLVWVHYRGFLVLALLAAGNLFCAGCPFVKVRDWGRRLHAPVMHRPSWLRGKWAALVLFAAVLYTYELFDLWSLPLATTWLVIGYFAAAFVVDLVFTGATFCQHLCPVGQFNFIASTMSPLELRARDLSTCSSCRTADCIVGRHAPEPPRAVVQRGCELGLYMPSKVGNIDCTFCMDCVQACPHDNIALTARVPGLELTDTARRSAVGRLTRRPDLAALVVLFVFGALTNAFAMVRPVRQVEFWIADLVGTRSEAGILACLFAALILVAPAVLLAGAAWLTRGLTRDARQVFAVAMRYVYALVPFGFGVWLAHYGFHLLTGALVIVPITQSAAIDVFGAAVLGEPLWRWAGVRPGAVFPVQVGLLVLGTIGSLGMTAVMAASDYPGREGRAMAPWAALVLLLFVAAIWVMYQPMEMRGLGIGG